MIKYALTIAAALLLATHALAQKTGAQLNSEISTNFPDQSAGQITPSNLRTVTQDMVNSIMPTAPVVNGNNVCFNGTTGLLKDCGTSPPLSQLANTFYAAPNGSSGLPSFRLQVLADLPSTGNASSLLGNPTGSPAAPAWVTLDPTLAFAGTTLKCATFGAAQAGCVPASGGGTTAFMRADGNWATPAGGGNVTGPGSSTSGHLTTFSGATGTVIQDQTAVATAQDVGFGSGRPWCDVRTQGAVGDGVTDDTAAFASCLTEILTTKGYSSGVVYVPPSTNPYCLKTTNGVYGNVAIGINTGNSSTGGIIFQGGGVQGTGLSTCGVNQTVFRINNQWVSIRDLAVYGYGSRSTDAVFTGTPPTFQTVYCDAQGSQFNMHNVYVTGGATSIYLACSNYDLENVWASFAYGDGSHLFGLVTLASGGGEFHDSHVDMAWPVCQPAHGATIPAWQASHAYSTASCTAVTVTCLGVSFVIELKTSGTSAGSAPTCAPFGTNITDGTAVWQLVNRQTSYCVQIDTGAVEVQIREVDMTCAAGWNLGVTNTFAGTPPSQLTFTDITPGGGFNGIVNLTAGNQITFNGSEFSNCILAGCAAITTTGSFSGNLVTSGNRFFNGLGYCLNHSVGTGVLFSNNWCNGTDTVGINISASIANFVVSGNMIFPSAGNAWTLGNSVAHALVQNNVCNGSAISNGTPGASTSLQSPCL